MQHRLWRGREEGHWEVTGRPEFNVLSCPWLRVPLSPLTAQGLQLRGSGLQGNWEKKYAQRWESFRYYSDRDLQNAVDTG